MKFTVCDRLPPLLVRSNVVRYASQALLVAACEATWPRCSKAPHNLTVYAAKPAELNSEILDVSLQNVHGKRLGVLCKFKASYYSVNDAQLAVIL
jgi:hypothetical protein